MPSPSTLLRHRRESEQACTATLLTELVNITSMEPKQRCTRLRVTTNSLRFSQGPEEMTYSAVKHLGMAPGVRSTFWIPTSANTNCLG